MRVRQITHVVPVDGFKHEPRGCMCGPRVHENDGVAATLPEGVEHEPGGLTFVHQHLSEEAPSRYTKVDERDKEWWHGKVE